MLSQREEKGHQISIEFNLQMIICLDKTFAEEKTSIYSTTGKSLYGFEKWKSLLL